MYIGDKINGVSLAVSHAMQDEQCMHLTNYAINKTSKDFIRDDDVGSKRRISTVNQWFAENGYNVTKLWADIEVYVWTVHLMISKPLFSTGCDHQNSDSSSPYPQAQLSDLLPQPQQGKCLFRDPGL